MTNKFLIGLLVAIPALSGTTRGLIVEGLKLSDIITLLLTMMIMIVFLGRWKIFDDLGLFIALFAGIAFFSTFTSYLVRPELPQSNFFKDLVSFPQYLLIYLVAYAIGQKSADFKDWLKPSLVVAAVISLIAILQVLDIGSTRLILSSITGNNEVLYPDSWKIYRGSSLFSSWHAFGMYLAVIVVFASSYLGRGLLTAKESLLYVSCIVVSLIGILTTATATPLILAVLGLLWFTLSPKRLLAVVFFGWFALLLLSQTTIADNISKRLIQQSNGTTWLPQSLEYRLLIWERDFLPIIEKNLWLGFGPSDSIPGVFDYSESQYIELLIVGGIPLLLAFLFMIAVSVRKLTKISRLQDSLIAPSEALRFVIVSLLVASIVHPYFNDAGVAQVVFVTLGFISGLSISKVHLNHETKLRLQTSTRE